MNQKKIIKTFENFKKKFDISKYYPLFFTIIFVFILFQYSFNSLEAIFYDLRVQNDFGIRFKDNIVVITMDEESDQFLGEIYPYTYSTHGKLFQKLMRGNPKIIAYLTNLAMPESESDDRALITFKTFVQKYVSSGGKFRFGTDADAWGEQIPPKELRELGYSLGLLNTDNMIFAKDDVARRAILDFAGERSLHFWIANIYRESVGLPVLSSKNIKGASYNREADASFAMYRYYTNPIETKTKIKRIPFHRVAVGNFPSDFFKDKIVLLGPSYISNNSDYILTPFNREEYKTPKLNVHAAIIQALIDNKTVYTIPRSISYGLSIVIAIALSMIISRLRPTKGLLITASVMGGVFIVSYLMFAIFGYWLYLTHLVLTVFVVYYIWVPFRAIGEYQRRFAIQEETKLLKKVEDLKQNFISLMSHDLKTPVAKISGIADIAVQQYDMEDKVKDSFVAILESTKELNQFITSILDLTKIESRNIHLNIISKDINPIIEQIIMGLKHEAHLKKIKFETQLNPLYPIEFDVDLIKRVISNIIENGIKYAGVDACITVKTWDDEKWVTIEISDNGVGIDKENLAHIFDKFYRVKNDASHSIKGSGLGLYLVKYFVELHGGQISATSELGQGTTFTIKLLNR